MLAIASYSHFTGALGSVFIATSCVIFAFATLVCQFFYGMRALEFISSSRLTKGLYSIVFILVCVLSSIISNEVMWSISDFIVCSLALYNMIFLIKLSKKIDF
jgi:Na+/alanine symporter